MSVKENLDKIKNEIPSSVELIAVSKFHSASSILEAYNIGQKIFGESREQEIDKKYEQLPKDIEWHFIGHLQTNKVKRIAPYIHTIHSIDSWKLLSEIEKQAKLIKKRIRCMLEIHISELDDSKYGFSYNDCRAFLENSKWKDCEHAYIGGIMGIATYTTDITQVRKEFKHLKYFYEEIKTKYFRDNNNFTEISMGMSNDYKIALEEGSTMIRIGTAIFGEREY